MSIRIQKVAWSIVYMRMKECEAEAGAGVGAPGLDLHADRVLQGAACLSVPTWDSESLPPPPPRSEPSSCQFLGCVSGRWAGASPRFCPLKLIDFCADFYSTNVIVR